MQIIKNVDKNVVKFYVIYGSDLYCFEGAGAFKNCLNFLFSLKNCTFGIFYDLTACLNIIVSEMITLKEFAIKIKAKELIVYLITINNGSKTFIFYSYLMLNPQLFETNCNLLSCNGCDILNQQIKNLSKYAGLEVANLFEMWALTNFLETFYRKYNLKILKNKLLSPAVFALKCFAVNFNTHSIPLVIEQNLAIYIRRGYFGGRCEIFANPSKSDKLLQHLDFNGMYAQCMREQLPTNLGVFKEKKYIDEPGFYEVTFSSKDMYIPVLGVKSEQTKKLMFANGVQRGLYWYEEIMLFLQEGGEILEIHSAYIFEDMDFVFKSFVDEFSKYRLNTPLNKFAKHLINALYGKLGAEPHPNEVALVFENDLEDFQKHHAILKALKIENYFLIEFVGEKQSSKTNNIIYPSIITAKARIKLFRLIQIALKNGCKVFYCDTDSVFISPPLSIDLLPDGVRVVDAEINDAVFILPRVYALKTPKKIELPGGEMGDVNSFLKLKKNFYSENTLKSGAEGFIKKTFIKYDKRLLNKSKKATRAFNCVGGFYL